MNYLAKISPEGFLAVVTLVSFTGSLVGGFLAGTIKIRKVIRREVGDALESHERRCRFMELAPEFTPGLRGPKLER